MCNFFKKIFGCLYFCFIKSTLARFGESPSFRIGVQPSGRGFCWDGESAPASLGKVAGRRWRNADKSCPDGVCKTGALYVVGGYSALDFFFCSLGLVVVVVAVVFSFLPFSQAKQVKALLQRGPRPSGRGADAAPGP